MRDSLNRQPHLSGHLVELPPLLPADHDALYNAASDPLIWEQHPPPDRHQESPFRRFFEDAIQSGGALGAVDRRSGEVIGPARFHWTPESELEIGWIFLSRSHWGGRYSAEVVSLMLEHAFHHVTRVLWLAGVDNVRSQRAAEKLGAMRVGSRLDAEGHESHIYAFERPDQAT